MGTGLKTSPKWQLVRNLRWDLEGTFPPCIMGALRRPSPAHPILFLFIGVGLFQVFRSEVSILACCLLHMLYCCILEGLGGRGVTFGVLWGYCMGQHAVHWTLDTLDTVATLNYC